MRVFILFLLLNVGVLGFVSAAGFLEFFMKPRTSETRLLEDLSSTSDKSGEQRIALGRVGGTYLPFTNIGDYPFWVLLAEEIPAPLNIKLRGIGIAYNSRWVLTTKYNIINFHSTNGTVNRNLLIISFGDPTVLRTSRIFYYDSGSDLALVQVCPSLPQSTFATLATATPAVATVLTYATGILFVGEDGENDVYPYVVSKTVGEECECDFYSKMDLSPAQTTFCLSASSQYSNWDPTTSFPELTSGVFVMDSNKKVIGFVITASNSSSASEVVFDLTKNSRSSFLALAVEP